MHRCIETGAPAEACPLKMSERALMTNSNYQIRQLTEVLPLPESGKKSVVLSDDEKTKVLLFVFAAGSGLAEHVAPFPAIVQIIEGEATITVGQETVKSGPGTWIQMAAKTPHSIQADTPVTMLLTLLK